MQSVYNTSYSFKVWINTIPIAPFIFWLYTGLTENKVFNTDTYGLEMPLLMFVFSLIIGLPALILLAWPYYILKYKSTTNKKIKLYTSAIGIILIFTSFLIFDTHFKNSS